MEQKGLSSAQIATQLDISRESISQWFSHQKFPRPKHLLALANLLELKFDEIVNRSSLNEPIIQFRKYRRSNVKPEEKARARELGFALRFIVPYLPEKYRSFFQSIALSRVENEYHFYQEVASEVRSKVIGVSNDDIISIAHILNAYERLRIVLIPVIWSDHKRSALHVFLPRSSTTFVYINLSVNIEDTLFMLLHELVHALIRDVTNKRESVDEEHLCDGIASAILFPEGSIRIYRAELKRKRSPSAKAEYIRRTAKDKVISPTTVYKAIRAFESAHREETILPKEETLHKQHAILGETKPLSSWLCSVTPPTADNLISQSKIHFRTPFFDALKSYLISEDKAASAVQAILDIPLLDAHEIALLLKSEKAQV